MEDVAKNTAILKTQETRDKILRDLTIDLPVLQKLCENWLKMIQPLLPRLKEPEIRQIFEIERHNLTELLKWAQQGRFWESKVKAAHKTFQILDRLLQAL